MNNDVKKQLDRLQRRERLKNIIPVILILFILMAVFGTIYAYRYSSGDTTKITGTVIGVQYMTVTKTGEKEYFLVKLDDGEVVMVRAPANEIFRKNKKAYLRKTKTKILGNVRYDFIGYTQDILDSPTSH
jgi:hypothetical protein